MSFLDEGAVDNARPFAVRLEGTDRFLKVHRGRNGLPSGMLTWESDYGATWFETREQAERQRVRLIGEKAVVHDARTFR
jgi:hypothetical protein